jgi:hypothetical protein
MADDDLRLTTEQRIAALERANVVLRDRTKILHDMLKQQRQLINDYITQTIALAGDETQTAAPGRPEDALYTFVCRQRFERVERDLNELRVGSHDHAARRKAV